MINKINGKGVVFVPVNDTLNIRVYQNNKELKEMVSKLFYKDFGLTIVDCEDKNVIFIDTEEDLKKFIENDLEVV